MNMHIFDSHLCARVQQASGIFTHIVTMMQTTLPVAPTRDLSPDALTALSALMLAEAQECFIRKAIRGE